MPGSSELEIEVWEFDKYVKDDLIGITKIDLENRYFSIKWRKYTNLPIETRPLYHPSSSI